MFRGKGIKVKKSLLIKMKKSLVVKKNRRPARKYKWENFPRCVSYRISYNTPKYEIDKINDYLKLILENKFKSWNEK